MEDSQNTPADSPFLIVSDKRGMLLLGLIVSVLVIVFSRSQSRRRG